MTLNIIVSVVPLVRGDFFGIHVKRAPGEGPLLIEGSILVSCLSLEEMPLTSKLGLKRTPVSKYRHEIEPVGLMLITVSCDATRGLCLH